MNKKLLTKGIEQVIDGVLLCIQAFEEKGEATQAAAAAVETAPEAINGTGKKEKKSKGEAKSTASKKAAVVEAEEPEETEEEIEASDESEESDEITEDDLRTKLVEFAQENGKDAAYAILGKYKAKKVNELDEKHYAKVMAELTM